jgi:hypothetical protein
MYTIDDEIAVVEVFCCVTADGCHTRSLPQKTLDGASFAHHPYLQRHGVAQLLAVQYRTMYAGLFCIENGHGSYDSALDNHFVAAKYLSIYSVSILVVVYLQIKYSFEILDPDCVMHASSIHACRSIFSTETPQ